jgi:periplasmic protein TonB
MFPIEPLDMEDVAELLSVEAPGDTFGLLCKIGSPVSEPKKWSSLAIALFMHCALAVAIFAAGKPQPPSRHDWIEVQLVASSGGLEGEGSVAPAAVTETGDSGSKAEEQEHCPPSIHDPDPSVLSRKDQVREKPPKHVPERMQAPSTAHLKKRTSEKKMAKEEARHSKEEPPVKPESNGATDAASSNSNPTAVGQGQGTGVSSGVGPGPPGQPAGNGMSGFRGDGLGEVAFGFPCGPRFLHKVMPSYPSFARKLEKEGAVLLRVAINEEGQVVDVEILKKAGFGFDEAAVKAIRESTFIPAKRDGRSFSCKALLPIRFELKSSDMD